ncbi:MAG: hypothetical protein NTU49_07795, partial [Gammaproteobacteria bacterium]|nr:hypothetical protein [Gammaproteobacteria bacterium]
IVILSSPSPFLHNALNNVLTQNSELYNEVYFDLTNFEKIFKQENGLKTPIGERYITLLENAANHLNEAMSVLTGTIAGRDLLRKKLRIDAPSGKFFFGKAEISAESLQAQVNGKSIREWLSITTAMEVALDEEQKARQAIDVEAQTAYRHLQAEFSRARLFLLRGVRGAATAGQRISSDAVNPTLQQVVYGNENAVKAELEAVKSNPTQLSALLSDTGTVKDYSDRTITGMTLLQAAAAAGDVDMCLMLKNYMSSEEFSTQLAEIFLEGIEAHESEQQRNTFNFDAILAAIREANTPDLDAALNKTDNGSALCRALEEFRRQFTEISNREKIFNPQHLLRAFEVYNALWDQCERDGNDRDYKKRDLFWRQIIGYTQRFMPACYAQAFSQGLYYLVKVDQPDSWRPEAFKRDLKLRCDNFSYFPLPLDSRSGLGFDFAIYAGRADGARCAAPCRLPGPASWVASFFKNFCRAKTAGFQNITPRVRVQSRDLSDERRCVVQ